MVTPAERFRVGNRRRRDTAAIAPPSARPEGRGDGVWVARRASAVGVVCVNWQQVSLGVAAAGRNIDVWVTDEVLQFFDGDHLLRTEQRNNAGAVRKKRASIPPAGRQRPNQTSVKDQPKQIRQPSTEARQGHVVKARGVVIPGPMTTPGTGAGQRTRVSSTETPNVLAALPE